MQSNLVFLSNKACVGVTNEATITRQINIHLPSPGATPAAWEELHVACDQNASKALPFPAAVGQQPPCCRVDEATETEFMMVLGPTASRTAQYEAVLVVAAEALVRATLGDLAAEELKSWALLHWSKDLLSIFNPAGSIGQLFRCAHIPRKRTAWGSHCFVSSACIALMCHVPTCCHLLVIVMPLCRCCRCLMQCSAHTVGGVTVLGP